MGTPAADNLAQQMVAEIEDGTVMMTKYIFMAEGMDENGARAMYSAGTNGIAIWEEMGILEFGKGLCLSKMIRNERGNDG